jgi:hypothetical protein
MTLGGMTIFELLLHHLLMYSNHHIMHMLAERVKQELDRPEQPTTTTTSSSLNKQQEQEIEFRCMIRVALVGVYLLEGDTTTAGEMLEEIREMENWNPTHSEECELMLEAMTLWLDGNSPSVLQIHEKLFDKYPTNLWSLYFAQQHVIYLYELKWFYQQIKDKIMPAFFSSSQWKPDTTQYGHYVKAIYCFVLEELNEMAEAEKEGIEAQQMFENFVSNLDPSTVEISQFKNPWTHHSMAHVYHTSGRFTEGIEYMQKHSSSWNSCSAFMETHNYWHLGLLYLARRQEGDVQKACDILRKHMWIEHSVFPNKVLKIPFKNSESKLETIVVETAPKTGRNWKQDPNLHYGAIGFLWKVDQLSYMEALKNHKLDLFDKNQDDIWDEITHYSSNFVNKHLSPFLDFHYAYLVARNYATLKIDEKAVQNYLSGLCHRTSDPVCGEIYKHMVIPLTNGILAFVQNQHQYAHTILKHIFNQYQTPENIGSPKFKHNSLGGSLLQREVLDTLWQILEKVANYNNE